MSSLPGRACYPYNPHTQSGCPTRGARPIVEVISQKPPPLTPPPEEEGDLFFVTYILSLLPFLPRRKGLGDGGNTPQTTAGVRPALLDEIISIFKFSKLTHRGQVWPR
jgi:hypothetical protein